VNNPVANAGAALLLDRERLRLSVAGTRVPPRAVAQLHELDLLLREAAQVLAEARTEAQTLREQARADGHAEGLAAAREEALHVLGQAQLQAREFVAQSEPRIAELAVAIVQRVAPGLDQEQLVASLARQALRAAQAERHLAIRVPPDAVGAAQAVLREWQSTAPPLESAQVLGDETLGPGDCVVESELGSIRAGLGAQLDAVRAALTAAVPAP
jgi:type III secretion protein L